jgi:DNA (cytosine-5)-methyltransferase 1
MGRKASILAINHWQVAIQTHSANNDGVSHLCESVDHIDPTQVVPGLELDLLWASPACTHHSVARGGRPRCEQQRAPAWIIPYWLENLKVKRLIIENVPEFQSWGPLDDNGQPVKEAKGETYKAFIAAIRSLGYAVEWRVLNAANYGDPTIRRRLFIQAIKGTGNKIRWPEVTHSEKPFSVHGLPTWIPAREIIDASLHGESIFGRKKPLAAATLRRIEHGISKYWGKYAEPFLIILRGTSNSRSLKEALPAVTCSGAHYGLIEPFITRFHGGHDSARRNHSIKQPLSVIDTSNRYGLVEPFITAIGQSSARDRSLSLDEPLSTVVTKNEHVLIEPFLVKYYGTGEGVEPISVPLSTITTKDKFALVEAGGKVALDIRFRMLQPHELAAAQGFPRDYKFCGNKTEVTRQIGNAVPVNTSRELAYCCLMTEAA